ncbi:MAG: hypothetical protein KDD60_03890 [Bdellovibrionales bacterium]|nr:hypothetical protein [Bdellovibrionales bacterium]
MKINLIPNDENYQKALENLKRSLFLAHTPSKSSSIWKTLSNYYTSEKPDDSPITPLTISLISNSEAPLRLRNEISKLEEKAQKQAEEISKHATDAKKATKEVEKLQSIIDELSKKQGIQYLLDSVSGKAHKRIEADEEFRERFFDESEVDAFVVSVDIRRSTELMLKARTPKLFAGFITTLCNDLEVMFKDNWGVVDKFTGDGILAFFPRFYSGEDAGYFALRAAKLANDAFEKRYREFRSSFTTVLSDVGLGIGIDFGRVHLVRMAGALTIVGQPVVYACRMGGAPAGKIFLNQPAFEVVSEKYALVTRIEETLINIKAEGNLVAYDTKISDQEFKPRRPAWIDEG